MTRLVAPDAVAATVSAAEVERLRADPAVAEIVPDAMIRISQVHTEAARSAAGQAGHVKVGPSSGTQPGDNHEPATIRPLRTQAIPPNCPSAPVQEPEAVADIHASNGNPKAPDEANSIATGEGVIIANEGMNALAGNPDLQRADGSHVVINAPDYTADRGNDETFEDAASVGAQGLIVYQYSKALPFSNLSPGCKFTIKGDAPDASLVDLSQIDTPILALSQIIAGIDNAVTTAHADVISESFGTTSLPGSGFGQLLAEADEAAVAAGVTVVESSGDSGPQGTMITAADDPAVIAAGGVDNLHIVALNDGYHSYVSNNMAAQSSGATAPTGKVVDLVASDWFGGETDCAPLTNGCALNYPTEVAAGTSEAAPLIAGAAADVIQAYRDTHHGASPTPAMIKDILTGTATNIDAPADQQGGGLLNVYAAVRAAQQMPGTTDARGAGDAPGLISSPSQLDITGDGGTVSDQSVSLYNASTRPVKVTGSYRWIGPEVPIGRVVTENVSAPDPSLPVPEAGATAAKTIAFNVPPHLSRLDADMIWPDPTNSNVLEFVLFNPQGAIVQESYDDATPGRVGRSPNIQHAEVTDPAPGRWTARFLWGGIDDFAEIAPAAPGTYQGPMSFRVSGQEYRTAPAIQPVTIPARSSVPVPLRVAMPDQAGDHPESLQLSASNGAADSVPIARRTLIPSGGGSFQTLVIGTSARSVGQINTYEINVPAGQPDLDVTFHTADASPDNIFNYFLVNPSGTVVATASTPQTVNGQASGDAELSTPSPVAGLWQIDVVLRLTVSGDEFSQTVSGNVTEGESG
ncbi:MAG TPA: S8 family serine peptidase [Streptosporangiaceae bacterium]|nr:S8 family serine peptidase [Streptosporangiaceae bacterium]